MIRTLVADNFYACTVRVVTKRIEISLTVLRCVARFVISVKFETGLKICIENIPDDR